MGLSGLPFEDLYMRIYEVVAEIPEGKVATYGQIAKIVGPPCHARMVGWALHATPAGLQIPWQRVINSRGEISVEFREQEAGLQRNLLEAEGVAFDARGRTDLRRFQWAGPDREWLLAHGYPVGDEGEGPRQLELL